MIQQYLIQTTVILLLVTVVAPCLYFAMDF